MTISFAAAQDIDEIISKNILAHGKKEVLDNIKTSKTEMVMTIMGQTLPMTIYTKKPDKARTETKVMGNEMMVVFNGDKGWMKQMGEVSEIQDKTLSSIRSQFGMQSNFTGSMLNNLRAAGAKVELQGTTQIHDRDYYKIKITTKENLEMLIYIDKITFLEYKLVTKLEQMGSKDVVEILFQEFKDFNGVLTPNIMLMTKGEEPLGSLTIKNYEFNMPLDDKLFEKPE
jgi:outer membrane lipoprotein-sorting protein